jgi:hypothetical protein
VTARAGDDHAVQCGVDLAVAAPVESVALRVARAGGDRRDAGGAGELGRCGEALGAGDLADEVVPFAVELRGGDPVISEWLRA